MLHVLHIRFVFVKIRRSEKNTYVSDNNVYPWYVTLPCGFPFMKGKKIGKIVEKSRVVYRKVSLSDYPNNPALLLAEFVHVLRRVFSRRPRG